ncbi:PucR family transcriptional regulator [Rhodococcus sp. EPR-157]|uniref:PucR family transcriptional regulator n=1 Tax=Rhodococcus sp. EPR-157 TaxID=1813677 RepID=UPI0007BB471C|nr:PucR family transcriptional regulator [Rhodococcus sp. EPR-157]KZF10804.1 PucR family transcriptional regulator [Rhodococcus sp. EPR-157]
MQPSLAEILALPVLQAGDPQVLGGPLDSLVRWVHVSDVFDLSELLQGGELVLTTGQPLTDPSLSHRYLRGLAAAGAIGLIVELNARLSSLPDDMAELADALGFTLIVLHRPIKFVEVTEHVHRSIVAEQYEEAAFARHVHEVFTALSMNRATLSDITDAVADLLGVPVVLEGLNKQVLAFAAMGTPASTLLADWERRSRLAPSGAVTTVAGPEDWLISQVGQYRGEWGRLIVPMAAATPKARMIMALERAAQALALHRMVEQDRTAFEQQAQSGLIDELRRGRIHDEAEATTRARALGLYQSLLYVPLTVRVAVAAPNNDQVQAQRQQVAMSDAIRHAVASTRNTALTASRRPGEIDLILAPSKQQQIDDALQSACAAIESTILRLDGVTKCAIGAGAASVRVIDAAVGLTDSAHVASVALSMAPSGRSYYRATDIRLRGLLAALRDDPRVQAFAESELRGLLDPRARHGDDLFEVLRQFLDTAGNKTVLARKMHLSRPTLYAKLASIQRILAVDLEDAESRTSLHAAMLVLDVPPVGLNR